MKTLATILLILSLSLANATDLNSIYEIVAKIESNNNPDAIGDGGRAYGIVQIHKIAIDDVNRLYGTEYEHEDAFNEEYAKEIFILYLTAGINHYKDKCGYKPTEEYIVRMWNGGFYKGYEKKSTVKYYKKYVTIKQRRENI